MKTAFVTDSACGIHPDVMKEQGVYSLPLQIVFADDGVTKLDFVDASAEEIYGYIKEGKMMSTSIPPLGLIENLFKELKAEGYEAVFCIPINPGLSSCFNALRLCAEEVGLEYIHVDIHTTSVMQSQAIIRAKKMYDEGKSIDEIKCAIQEFGDNGMTFVIPNDLDHLKKGGRLTPLAATLAGLLKIKPILKIDASCDGKIDVFDKIRTFGKAVDRVVTELENRHVDETYEIWIASSDGKESAEITQKKLKEKFPNHDIKIVDLVTVISVHTGCDCVGVQAFKKA